MTRRSLYIVIEEKYPTAINDSDMDSIEDDIAFYLREGFTIDECVDAAVMFYHKNPCYDDDPAACFGYGMHEHLSH